MHNEIQPDPLKLPTSYYTLVALNEK